MKVIEAVSVSLHTTQHCTAQHCTALHCTAQHKIQHNTPGEPGLAADWSALIAMARGLKLDHCMDSTTSAVWTQNQEVSHASRQGNQAGPRTSPNASPDMNKQCFHKQCFHKQCFHKQCFQLLHPAFCCCMHAIKRQL